MTDSTTTKGGARDGVATGRNAILMYHSIGEPYPDGRCLSKETFRQHMAYLNRNFQVVDLPEVIAPVDTERRIALTFDAGYENFYNKIYPILKEFGFPATQFVIPDRIGVTNDDAKKNSLGIDWFDFMDEAQLRDLAESEIVTIGNKTLTHMSILPTIRDDKTLHREVGGGRRCLQELFNVSADRFCYGSGRFDPKSIEVVGEHHAYAVGTIPRLIDQSVDPLTLPRIDMDLTDIETFKRKLTRRFEIKKRINSAVARFIGSWYPDAYERLRKNEPD
jgi:peptidoglycan/xylan/chitin deacetylase (PgdA/CDA1 family)